jgi:hypothetical protein
MPLTSVTKDVTQLTLTVVGDYPVPQKRLWDGCADPHQTRALLGSDSHNLFFRWQLPSAVAVSEECGDRGARSQGHAEFELELGNIWHVDLTPYLQETN